MRPCAGRRIKDKMENAPSWGVFYFGEMGDMEEGVCAIGTGCREQSAKRRAVVPAPTPCRDISFQRSAVIGNGKFFSKIQDEMRVISTGGYSFCMNIGKKSDDLRSGEIFGAKLSRSGYRYSGRAAKVRHGNGVKGLRSEGASLDAGSPVWSLKREAEGFFYRRLRRWEIGAVLRHGNGV